MDLYEKLSRALMRRKYEKVDRSSSRSGQEFVVMGKTVVKVPKPEKEKLKEKEKDAKEPLSIVNPKRFTILSSGNEVVDEAWLKDALRRTIDQGRIEVLTKSRSWSSPPSPMTTLEGPRSN